MGSGWTCPGSHRVDSRLTCQGPMEEVQEQSWRWDPRALDGLHISPSRALLRVVCSASHSCALGSSQLLLWKLAANPVASFSAPHPLMCLSPAHLVLLLSLLTNPPSCQPPFLTCWSPWSQNLSLSVEAQAMARNTELEAKLCFLLDVLLWTGSTAALSFSFLFHGVLRTIYRECLWAKQGLFCQ